MTTNFHKDKHEHMSNPNEGRKMPPDICINCNRDMARYCQSCMAYWIRSREAMLGLLREAEELIRDEWIGINGRGAEWLLNFKAFLAKLDKQGGGK